jgi:hypothetical protein
MATVACGTFSGTDTVPPAPDATASSSDAGATSKLDATTGAEGGDATVDASGGLDCALVSPFLYCEDFDGRQADSLYADAGPAVTLIQNPFLSAPNSLRVTALPGELSFIELLTSGSTANGWTVSFNYWFDATVPAGATIARIGGSLTVITTDVGISIGSFSPRLTPNQWAKISVSVGTGVTASTAKVSVEGTTANVAAPTGPALDLGFIGLVGSAPATAYFDDALATSP